MDIKKMMELLSKPKLYEKGNAEMWTDKYISKHLLTAHINTGNNIASRKGENIDKLVEWIIKELKIKKGNVLDLGCGPGLYTEKFCKKGFQVTGVDFSETSILYAKNSAKAKKLNINYICDNYLNLNFENKYDLIIMIYCDFGVLNTEERKKVLNNINKALKQGGIFIFDTLNKNILSSLNFEKKWDISKGGFWQKSPYICLEENFHYPENKAILQQHLIIDEIENYKLYRFWNHYFTDEEISEIVKEASLEKIKSYKNNFFNEGLYNDTGVTFHKVIK